MTSMTATLELVIPAHADPALERALFFAELDYQELTATVPQALWTHCMAVS